MKHIVFKIIFIVAIFYPFISYSADTNILETLPVEKNPQIVQGNYYLLSIGIDNYINFPKLATSVFDTKEVTRVLMEGYSFDKGRVKELYDANATLKNILSALADINKDIKPEDSLLIYFEGHGALEETTKEGAWMPVDASQTDTSTWVKNSTIKEYISSNSFKAKHVLLISEASFSGGFFKDKTEKPEEITKELIKTAFSKTSREAITANGTELGHDAYSSKHSQFSHFFLKALNENSKDYLLPQSIYEWIRAGMPHNVSQYLRYGALSGTDFESGGSFVFFKNGGAERLYMTTNDTNNIQNTIIKEMEKAKAGREKELKEKAEKIAFLDRNIASLKERLGEEKTDDSVNLDNILIIVKEKEKQSKEFEELKEKAEKERIAWEDLIKKLKGEVAEKEKQNKEYKELKETANKENVLWEDLIKKLKEEEVSNKVAFLEKDILKYKEVAESEYGKELTVNAWNSLLDKWEIKKGNIKIGDIESFINMVSDKYVSMGEQALRLKVRLNIFQVPMVFVKGGCYKMGDTFGDGEADEKPAHNVCLDDFFIGKYEVTVGDFKKFTDSSGYKTEAEISSGCYVLSGNGLRQDETKTWRFPGFSQTDNDPVVCVSWNDANKYIDWLSKSENRKYRLPTEAEWEYAARSGGKNEKLSVDRSESYIGDYAWYYSNSGKKTYPVGQKLPNGLGIYDMSGNIWEWVSDWFGEKYYKTSPKNNPKGIALGEYKVLRGGSWTNYPEFLRVTYRSRFLPTERDFSLGFRLVLSYYQ